MLIIKKRKCALTWFFFLVAKRIRNHIDFAKSSYAREISIYNYERKK